MTSPDLLLGVVMAEDDTDVSQCVAREESVVDVSVAENGCAGMQHQCNC